MTINELIETAHTDAKAKGWWDEPRNTGELLMLIVSECGKALEAHRKGRQADLKRFDGMFVPQGFSPLDEDPPMFREDPRFFVWHIKDTFEDELADIVIRIVDLCGHFKMDFEDWIPQASAADPSLNIGEWLLQATKRISRFDEAGTMRYELVRQTVSVIFMIACAHNIDLWRHIKLKLAYNRTRPHKHGKAY